MDGSASAGGQGREPDSRGSPQHASDHSAVVSFDFGSRSIQELSSSELFKFLSSKIPTFDAFEASWRISGANLLEFGPTNFILNLQSEVRVLPRSICVEVFVSVQNRIVHELQSFQTAGSTPAQVPALIQAWALASIPTRVAFEQEGRQSDVNPQVLANLFSPGSRSFGDSSFKDERVKKRRVVYGGPAQAGVQLFQSGLSQLMHPVSASASLVHQYPALSMSLAGFQTPSLPLPYLPVMPQSSFPSSLPSSFPSFNQSGSAMNSSATDSFTAIGSATNRTASNTAMNSSAQWSAMPNSAPLTATPPALMTSMQNSAHVNAMNTPPSATFNAMPNSAISTAMLSSLSQTEQAQLSVILNNPTLNPLFMKFAGATAPSNKPIMPWVTAAKARAPKRQDHNLPDGYKRINVLSLRLLR